MKVIPLIGGAVLLGCQSPQPAPSRPLMDSAMAEKLCANPSAVRTLGAECVLRDQSPPPPAQPRPDAKQP